ncbi:SDR family NAD(P)-dependent oxidoreductase [Hydrocarboniphaga effusa]|uniref:SDR family NAD(P)-dependent oxidoreductase n=1 Tax=Hydrocarboniphaga effusa TaxID=243629 RepID=UPI00398BCBD4
MTAALARRFENKVALVTGAGAGIGRAVALRLVEEGARVFAVSRGDNVEELAALHPQRIIAHRADVGVPEQIEAMVAACVERCGRIDVLCNNAGISHGGTPLHEIDLELWDQIMDVNLRGAFVVLKHVLPVMMRQRSGSIVNMSSVGGMRPAVGSAAYIVGKAGLNMLTRIAALEYVDHGIRINAVAPGTIRTPLVERSGAALIEFKESVTPMHRLGTPEEIAALTAFLASDEASYITGAIYAIDGGRCAE